MSDPDKFLREKAILLITRERELLSIRGEHTRLAAWLGLAQSLPGLIGAHAELSDICLAVTAQILSTFDLQKVFFLELVPPSRLRMLAAQEGFEGAGDIELTPDESAAIKREGAGAPGDSAAFASLARRLELQRFLAYRMQLVDKTVLLLAGYDEERAAFYPPFDEVDHWHFRSTGYQLQLLLGNLELLKALRDLNSELERRVEERTAQLSIANTELGRVVESLREKERHILEDISQARRFQELILPVIPVSTAVELSAVYQPLEQVGGDIYDVCEVAPGHLRVFIADATGHGVQASMRTLLLKTEYDRLKGHHRRPDTLLGELTRRLVALFPQGEIMCTACCVDIVLDGQAANVAFSNASNPPILHWSNRRVTAIDATGAFLGLHDFEWPEPTRFTLQPGDALLMSSDGLLEQDNDRGDRFDAWLGAANELEWNSAEGGLCSVLRAFERFKRGGAARDDITIVALRLKSRARD